MHYNINSDYLSWHTELVWNKSAFLLLSSFVAALLRSCLVSVLISPEVWIQEDSSFTMQNKSMNCCSLIKHISVFLKALWLEKLPISQDLMMLALHAVCSCVLSLGDPACLIGDTVCCLFCSNDPEGKIWNYKTASELIIHTIIHYCHNTGAFTIYFFLWSMIRFSVDCDE